VFGGSSEFRVELVDGSIFDFEAKMVETGVLQLLTPIRCPVDNGMWGEPRLQLPAPKPLRPQDIVDGSYWVRGNPLERG
jgi:hypothetical protein